MALKKEEAVITEVLKMIGSIVKKIGKLRPTETHKLQQILNTSNIDVKKISNMLKH